MKCTEKYWTRIQNTEHRTRNKSKNKNLIIAPIEFKISADKLIDSGHESGAGNSALISLAKLVYTGEFLDPLTIEMIGFYFWKKNVQKILGTLSSTLVQKKEIQRARKR